MRLVSRQCGQVILTDRLAVRLNNVSLYSNSYGRLTNKLGRHAGPEKRKQNISAEKKYFQNKTPWCICKEERALAHGTFAVHNMMRNLLSLALRSQGKHCTGFGIIRPLPCANDFSAHRCQCCSNGTLRANCVAHYVQTVFFTACKRW